MKTKEPQYNDLLNKKICSLGYMTNSVWLEDPRRLGFILSRYKFVSKMFSGMECVLEIGCGDGFCSRLVKSEVKNLISTDFDPVFIKNAKSNNKWGIIYKIHDILDEPFVYNFFDGVFSLDVLEHIPSEKENIFFQNVKYLIKKEGVCIIGTPSLESQIYASARSKSGHVNCKNAESLKKISKKHFKNVFIFSMNDEVIHTGFYPMANYLLALCCGKK